MHFGTIVKTYGNGPPPDPPPPPNIWKFPYVSLFLFLKASLIHGGVEVMNPVTLIFAKILEVNPVLVVMTSMF